MTIGILALQGDYEKHQQMIASMGIQTRLVLTQQDLSACSGLIIPGGESTTLTKLMIKHNLWDDIRAFGKDNPIFGTCAGLIVLANKVTSNHVEPLGLIDITVNRNAYGRQIDSFIDTVDLLWNTDSKESYEGFFIRAPKIMSCGPNVQILATHNNEPVMAEQGNILVATFHPELTNDTRIHQYFVQKIN